MYLRYASLPQNWNKYAYTLNNPLKFTDPDGRREITAEDERRFKILDGLWQEAIDNGDLERAEAIAQAQIELNEAIAAVPDDAREDPDNLQAAFWAIDRIGSTDYAKKTAHSNGKTVDYGEGSNKCNIFVAEAYALGAGVGFGGSGVPTHFSFRHPLTQGNVYQANELASGISDNVPRFPTITGNPIGGIIAFESPNANDSGHTGILIGSSLVVHAAAAVVKVDTVSALHSRLKDTYWGGRSNGWTVRIYRP